jgi:predicted MFS family arabinose efflux permease
MAVFGMAAAASTLIVAGVLGKCNRLHVWATSHALMAVGVILPCLWLSMTSIVLAALFVGGNFMVITMLGMQEARARAAANPTAVLARMTASFAFGQLLGPVVVALMIHLPPITQAHSATHYNSQPPAWWQALFTYGAELNRRNVIDCNTVR